MANGNGTRGPRRIPLRSATYFWGTMHEGTYEQLTQEAHIPVDWFAGIDRAHGKRSVKRAIDGSEVTVRAVGKYRFEVSAAFSETQRAVYEARREIAQKREQVQRQIDSWPKSFDAFRQRVESMVEFAYKLLERVPSGFDGGGYHFDTDTIGDISVHISAIRAAIAAGTVCLNRDFRDEIGAQLLAEVSGNDSEFAGFMGRISAGTPSAPNAS